MHLVGILTPSTTMTNSTRATISDLRHTNGFVSALLGWKRATQSSREASDVQDEDDSDDGSLEYVKRKVDEEEEALIQELAREEPSMQQRRVVPARSGQCIGAP